MDENDILKSIEENEVCEMCDAMSSEHFQDFLMFIERCWVIYTFTLDYISTSDILSTMNSKEKRAKGRREARPKKFISVLGWDVFSDERNWITSSKTQGKRYFSTLENALWYISEQMERGKQVDNLKEVVKEIKQTKSSFLKALSTSLAKQG